MTSSKNQPQKQMKSEFQRDTLKVLKNYLRGKHSGEPGVIREFDLEEIAEKIQELLEQQEIVVVDSDALPHLMLLNKMYKQFNNQ